MAIQLCSEADVRGRITTSLATGPLTDLIESISDEIEAYVGAWLAPRSDTTLLFDVARTGSSLRMEIAGRRVGVRALTALGIASSGQPETGGVFTTVPLANVLLRPRPSAEGIASNLVLTSGSFSRGFNTVSATGSFGPATVAPRTREAAIELVMFALNANPGLASESVGDWSQSYEADDLAARDAILATLSPMGLVAI